MTHLFMNFRRFSLITAAAVGLCVTGCAQMPSAPADANVAQTYVLVHGAFENKSVWNDVRHGLERAGQSVISIDLPGRSVDATVADQASLDAYRDAVERRIASVGKPVILVGHSFGGITISNVAEMHPELVRTLVYVAALLPKDGDSAQLLSRQDKNNGFAHDDLEFSTDQRYVSVKRSSQLKLFCSECTSEQASKIEGRLGPEPVVPLRTPVRLSAARYGQVDKIYVVTDSDRVISPQAQQDMLNATPVRRIVHLSSGHVPFISRPVELVKVLLAVRN